jgi:WD40 repeat protein
MPRVFVSYSHDSPSHNQNVLALANRLRADGVDAVIDQYEPNPPEGWMLWTWKQIRDSDFVIVVCTDEYCRRVVKESDLGVGHGACWEGNLILQYLYDNALQNRKFVPVVFNRADEEAVLTPLRAFTRYCLEQKQGYEELFRFLTAQRSVAKPKLGKPKVLPLPSDRDMDVPAAEDQHCEAVPPPRLCPRFFGRAIEVETLKRWIIDDRYPVVAIAGLGGAGKSSLTLKVCEHLRDRSISVVWADLKNRPSAAQVVRDWIRQISPADTCESAADIANLMRRLAQCLSGRRCALVLDNAETVLETDGDYRRVLVTMAAGATGSSLVLTSRVLPAYLALLEAEGSARCLRLGGLAIEDAVQLIKGIGVTAPERDLRALAELYDCHVLALRLACCTIRELFGGRAGTFLRQRRAIHGELRELLDEHVQHAGDRGVAVLYWMAIGRDDVTIDTIQADLADRWTAGQLLDVLEALRRWHLIEPGSDGDSFALQPVILEYLTERFVDVITRELQHGALEFTASHGLLKANAKEFVRQSQERCVLDPIISRLRPVPEQGRLDVDLGALMGAARRTAGYAAGNLVNLMRRADYDFTGADLSGLTIRRAYLEGTILRRVDFSDTSLVECRFTNEFDSVMAVSCCPQGGRIAFGGADGHVRIWRLPELLGETTLSQGAWVRGICFNPDGSLVAAAGDDGVVRVWNVSSGQEQISIRAHKRAVKSLAWGERGLLATACSDGIIGLWDSTSGKCARTICAHAGHARSVAFLPGGDRVVSGGDDRLVKVWDTASGECVRTFTGHTERVRSVAAGTGGRTIASGSADRTAIVWDVDRQSPTAILEGHQEWISSVAFSSNGRILATASGDKTVKLWQVDGGRLIRTLTGHARLVWSVAFDTTGEILLTGSDDQSVRAWDPRTGVCTRAIHGQTSWIISVAFSPDGSLLASGSGDRSARLWDVRNGTMLKSLRGHTDWVTGVAFSPSGRVLATSSDDGTVRLWHPETGDCTGVLTGHTDRVKCIAFSSAHEPLIASGSHDRSVRLWNPITGTAPRVLNGHSSWVRAVAFSPHGETLATGSDDQTIVLWNKDGAQIRTLRGHTSVVRGLAFSPDGSLLASASNDRTVRVWHVARGECIRILEGHCLAVWSVSFSPGGTVIASGGDDCTVRRWNVVTGACLEAREHTSWVTSVCFSPAGQILATGSQDETIKLWNADTMQSQQTLRSGPYEGMKLTRTKGLTPAQRQSFRRLGSSDAE